MSSDDESINGLIRVLMIQSPSKTPTSEHSSTGDQAFNAESLDNMPDPNYNSDILEKARQ
jgi:hypothetical protein